MVRVGIAIVILNSYLTKQTIPHENFNLAHSMLGRQSSSLVKQLPQSTPLISGIIKIMVIVTQELA